jgi:hypothetical protein
MNVKTLEHLIHSKTEWQKTIEEARAILRYDPSWSWEQRRQWDDQDCLANKQLTNFMALTFLAEKVINATEFSGQKALEHYWMACFYNDYKALGLDAIQLWPPHWEASRRVFPYLEWGIDYDPGTNVFRLEIPQRLLTKELLKEITDIKAILTDKRKGWVPPDIHQAKVQGEKFQQKQEVAEQIERIASGAITFTEALQEEYKRTLIDNIGQISSSPNRYARLEKLQLFRKRARERVRNRLKRAAIPIEYIHCNWWTKVEEAIL